MKLLVKMKISQKEYFSRFAINSLSQFSTTVQLKQQSVPSKSKSTVDFQDVAHLTQLRKIWWDVQGELRGLHAMNPLRIKFIRDGLVNAGFKERNSSHPLEGIKLLDVGCGGGILSEPLARLGANVVGLDASKELIYTAKQHASLDEALSSNLTYVHTTIEDFSQEQKEKFDVVVASEILEHVINQDLFIKNCSEVLKPTGSMFITTLNKNLISWLGAIVILEYLLRFIPLGTHDWNKFISPDKTGQLLEKYNCKTKSVQGMLYNLAKNQWVPITSTAVFYALHAVKQKSTQK